MNRDWIAPRRTALLLIDMQADFAGEDGALAKAGFDMTAPRLAMANARLLAAAARKAKIACIFVRLVTKPGAQSSAWREWLTRRGRDDETPLCREGSLGMEFVGVRPHQGEAVISKSRYSAFTGTGLDLLLRSQGLDTLVLAGLTTECCIDSTARDAFERDFHVVIAADAVAAYAPDLHGAALKALEINLATLADSAAIAAAWK